MPSDALRQAAADVPADSSPAKNEPDTSGNPGPDAGDHSGDSSASAKKGRTVEEVHGEMNRKFKDLQDTFANRFERLETMLTSRTDSPSPSANGAQKDLNSMSSAELEALRPHIPADKKDAYEALLRTRREEERVDSRIEERLSKAQVVERRKSANAEAYQRYPELHNQSSTFYREVNRVLDQWGDAVTRNNPFAVLQAANEAAHRLGVKPRALEDTSSATGRVGGRTKPAPDGEGGGKRMSRAEAESIASKLANALPAGKKFDLDRVIDRAAQYDEHIDLFIRK